MIYLFIFIINKKINNYVYLIIIKTSYLGIGDWGLGIGDWGLGIGPNPHGPNPQSPIPNPQSPILNLVE